MMGASLPEKGQDLRRRKKGRAIRPYPSLLSFERIAAGAAVTAVTAIAAVTARATIAAVTAVAAIPTVALAALVAAHHRRRALLMRVDAQGHIADDVLVDLGLALELGDDRGRRFEIEHHIMGLAVLRDPVGEGAQAPGLGLGDLAAIVLDDLGGGLRQRVHLGLGQVLTRKEYMLVERHDALVLLLADR